MKNITSLVKGTASFLYRHSRARGNPGFNLLLDPRFSARGGSASGGRGGDGSWRNFPTRQLVKKLGVSLLLALATSIAPRYAQSETLADDFDWPIPDNTRMTELAIRNHTDKVVRTIDEMVDSDCGLRYCRYVSANDYRVKLVKARLLVLWKLKNLCDFVGRGDECVYSDYIDALLRVAEDAPQAGKMVAEEIGWIVSKTSDPNAKNRGLRALARIAFNARPLSENHWFSSDFPWHEPAKAALLALYRNQGAFAYSVLTRVADPDIEKSRALNQYAYNLLQNCPQPIPQSLVEKHRKLREQEARKVQSSVRRYDFQRGNRQ